MLVVVTPASATRLTTPAHARADLNLAAGQVSDAQLGRMIDQASAAIVDWCRRPFALETVDETFFGNSGEIDALLSRAPTVEIVSATLDGLPLLAADYRFDAITNRVRAYGALDGYQPWWGAALAVRYRAGYVLPSDATDAPAATLPPSVERAAIRLVGAYLSAASRDPLIKTDTIEGVGSTSWWVPGANSALADPEAEQLLAPFRRLF